MRERERERVIVRDRETDKKMNTEDTLSGFQEFFLQPIIKDRSNLSQQITAGAGGTHIQKKGK